MAAPKARLDVWKPKLKNADGTYVEPERWVTCQTFEDIVTNKRRTNAVTQATIRDVLYDPREAQLWVANRAQDFKTVYDSTNSTTIANTTYTYVYNDSDGNAAHGGSITLAKNWGLLTHFFYEFQHVRVVDQQTNLVLYTGRIQKIDKRYEDSRGSVVVIDCRDALDELRHIPCNHLQKEVTFPYVSGSEWRRSDMLQYALNLGVNFQAANVMTQDAFGATKPENSMRTPIKTPLSGTAHNFISDNNASSAATNQYTRFEQSATSLDHDVVWELEKTGNKSLLQEIIRIAVAEPHEAETADDQFGYNFFLDANYGQYNLDATKGPGVAGWNPPMVNYGKRGNRLSVANQYGNDSGSAATQDPNVWGLKVHMPLVNSVISQGHKGTGGSVETASKVMQRSFDFENPKEELFTGAILTYEARNDNAVDGATGDTDEPVHIVRHKEFEICYVNYVERTSSNPAFFYRKRNIDDEWKEDSKDSPGVNSAEYLHAYQDNGSGAAGTLIASNVARVQYQSELPTGGGSSNTGASYSYLLLSDISKNFPDAADQASATHVILKGASSANLCRFNAKATEAQEGRPVKVWGIRKIFPRTQMQITRPDELRIEIASRLAQASTQVRRGKFQFSKAPYYWLDCYVRAISSVTGGQEIQVAHSSSTAAINVTPYGFREGMLIQKMTTDWVAMAKTGSPAKDVYGYCWEMPSSFSMKVNLTESVNFAVGDFVRLIIPLRAGDIIRVDNALGDVFADHVITELYYSEDLGPKCEVESIGNNEIRKGNPHKPNIWSGLYGLQDNEELKAEKKTTKATLGVTFSGTITYPGAGEIAWTAGNLTTSDGKTYQIAAGSTSDATFGLGNTGMTGTNTYEIHLDPDAENPASNQFHLNTTLIGDYKNNSDNIDLFCASASTTGVATPNIIPDQLHKQGSGDAFKAEATTGIHLGSATSALLKKGAQHWTTNIKFEGTDYNIARWGLSTAIGSNGAISFGDDASEVVTLHAGYTFAAGTSWVYKTVGPSAVALPVVTQTYSDVTRADTDRILMATVVVDTDVGQESPTIFPVNGNTPTISVGALAARSILATNIKAGAITTGELNFTYASEINGNNGLNSDTTASIRLVANAESGTIAGLQVSASTFFMGTGTYFNANTPFFVRGVDGGGGTAGDFSLGDKLKWDESANLLTLTGHLDAGSITGGSIAGAQITATNVLMAPTYITSPGAVRATGDSPPYHYLGTDFTGGINGILIDSYGILGSTGVGAANTEFYLAADDGKAYFGAGVCTIGRLGMFFPKEAGTGFGQIQWEHHTGGGQTAIYKGASGNHLVFTSWGSSSSETDNAFLFLNDIGTSNWEVPNMFVGNITCLGTATGFTTGTHDHDSAYAPISVTGDIDSVNITAQTHLATTAGSALTNSGNHVQTIEHLEANGSYHLPVNGASGQLLGYFAAGRAQWVAAPSTHTHSSLLTIAANDVNAGGALTGSSINVTGGVVFGGMSNYNAANDVRSSSSGTLYALSSSRRYKENIIDLDVDSSKIYSLVPRTFKWRDFLENETTIVGRTDFGYIAEEVHEVFPELVGYGDFEDGDNLPASVYYNQISILLVEEIKKLRARIEVLEGNG